jgi:D-glycero-D-manno-heptose 1,7-bisphosphate phosphatase
MQSAFFIDRDGTLIEQVEVLNTPSQLTLLPGVGEALANLRERGFLLIGITNQPSVEKGLITEEQLVAVHEALQEKLAESGARLDAIYTCPHQYRAEGQCACRKPGIGLIEQAQAAFPIDMEKSWLVGDRLRDVETGRRAGLKTILVSTGGVSKDDTFFPDAKPDHAIGNLSEILSFIE